MTTHAAAEHVARVLIRCPDRRGIVAAVSRFLTGNDANILSSHQYSTDPDGGAFFMRMEFFREGLDAERDEFEAEFAAEVAEPLHMDWRMTYRSVPKRVAILVSRHDHCLLDLLWRRRRGELDASIGLVVSNHEDLRRDAEGFGVPFIHIPVTPESKRAAEETLLDELSGRYDLLVLARYMQILSGEFLDRVNAPVINIHHSFLPAFPGAEPYARARERGVKLIGATAHYVTEELDAGPIIEQDVERVDHEHSVEELTRIGQDIERIVLTRAVKWHLEDRVLVHENRAIVFR